MTNKRTRLMKKLEKLQKQEEFEKKKRKPAFRIKKGKRLQYYSGWGLKL